MFVFLNVLKFQIRVLKKLTIRFSILALISLASVKKASSTFMLDLADVSINLIPYSTASCWPRSLETYKVFEFDKLTF